MSRQASQRERIKAHLKNDLSISPLYALDMFGCFRLAAVIHVLKNKEGMNIKTTMVDRDGKKYAVYTLVK